MKKLTNDDIVQKIHELVGDEYCKLNDVYKGTRIKFPIKHKLCGHEYEIAWDTFKQGARCPKCSGNIKLTNEEIVERMHELVDDEYCKLDDIYINANAKFPIKHNTCGNEYEVSWHNFQKGSRCPKCSGNIKLTNLDVIQRMYELVDDEYTKLNDIYVNADTKFPIKHNTCDHEYEVSWGNFQRGKRCPKCSGVMKLTNEDIVQRMIDLVSNEYSKLNDIYVNANTKFPIRHNICGHEYEVKWSNFQNGKRCPKCNQSKGEKFISDYLTNKHISFTTQVRFNDCRHKNTLPFDFGIVDSNKKIIALIEFDGEQHFKPSDFFGGEENLKQVQLRDSIKNQYCKDNNIPLLRIRYDEDIQEELDNFLGSLFF